MIEFLFTAILVIWLVGLLGRWLLRTWLVRKQREFAERFGGGGEGPAGAGTQARNARSARRGARREGDVSVRQTEPVRKKVNKSVGDYVEFEEVEIEDVSTTEETTDGK